MIRIRRSKQNGCKIVKKSSYPANTWQYLATWLANFFIITTKCCLAVVTGFGEQTRNTPHDYRITTIKMVCFLRIKLCVMTSDSCSWMKNSTDVSIIPESRSTAADDRQKPAISSFEEYPLGFVLVVLKDLDNSLDLSFHGFLYSLVVEAYLQRLRFLRLPE